jgi:hypothetical protein
LYILRVQVITSAIIIIIIIIIQFSFIKVLALNSTRANYRTITKR